MIAGYCPVFDAPTVFSVDAVHFIRYHADTMIRSHSLSVLALTLPLTICA